MVETSNENSEIKNRISAETTPMTEEEMIEAVDRLRKTSLLGYFFPILKQERKRVTLLCMMFCIISFTYAFLRMFKDRVVFSIFDNTETKNWLKLLTFLVTQQLVIFSQNVSSKTNFNNAFGVLTLYFAGFLALNTAAILAVKYLFSPKDLVSDLLFQSDSLSIRGLKVLYPLALVLSQIVYSAFYILAEVIGSMMVSFCFMTYVNNNTTENQNKRFVRALLFFSNISAAIAGLSYRAWVGIYEGKSKKESDIFYLIFPACAVGLYLVVLFIKSRVEKEFENVIVVSSGAPKKTGSSKKKIGFKDSIYYMMNSRFLRAMCGLSFFYNVTANLLETANASSLAATATCLGKDKSFYATGLKSFDLIMTSVTTSIILISPISLLPDKIGIAYFAAVPLVIGFVSSLVQLFFTITNFPLTGYDNIWPFTSYNSTTKYPVAEVYAGTLIQSCIKVAKYAFFDIVKELIAMKIEPANRPLFKGVFDGSITKFGKSVGSIYGIIMLNIFESFDARYYFPVTQLVITLFCVGWYLAIRYLSKQYKVAQTNKTYMGPDFVDPTIKL